MTSRRRGFSGDRPGREYRSATALGVCLIGIIGLLSIGCAGYRLGPSTGNPPGAISIEIQPLRNETSQPRLTESTTQALRRELQSDGTYRLATQDDGDWILSGSLEEYQRGAVSFDPSDVITPRDFQITVVARVHVRSRVTGEVVLDRIVTGRTTVRTGSDQVSSEHQSLPLLTGDLARSIVSAMADGDW